MQETTTAPTHQQPAPRDPNDDTPAPRPGAGYGTRSDLHVAHPDPAGALPAQFEQTFPRMSRHYDPVVPDTEAEETIQMAKASGAESAGKAPGPTNTNKGRIGVYFTPEEAARVRAAYMNGWVLAEGNAGTLSDWGKQNILADTERLENKYNKGQPWPALPAGAVRVVTHQQIADKKADRAEG